MVLVLPPLCLIRDFAWKYAKRMYFPQSYHHVQEIQKYNIQDYRPRYVFPNFYICSPRFTDFATVWSNSKKPSEKSDKCSVCANSVGMRFHKQTNHKLGCYKPMIPHSKEGGSERWRVRGNNPRHLDLIRGTHFTHRSLFGVWKVGGMMFLYDCAPSRYDVCDVNSAGVIDISVNQRGLLVVHF